MNRLILGNLLHRPLRSVISILAVAIEVVMILSIVGLMVGRLTGTGTRTLGIGMDILVQPGNTAVMQGVSGAPLSMKIAEKIKTVPHVAVVSPVNVHLSVDSNGLENIYGIDFPSFNGLKPFVFLSGGPFEQPNDVIIDDYEARAGKGHKVGDTINILNNDFRICGIVQHGRGGRKFIQLDTMDDLTGTRGKASAFYVNADSPQNIDAVVKGIQDLPGSAGVLAAESAEAWASMLTSAMPPIFYTSLKIVIGIAVVIGFLVIFQSMYTAVLERTREIGILKSMGASKLTIVSVVLRETAVLAVSGTILGVAFTYALKSFLLHHYPTLDFDFSTGWVVRGVLIAITGSLLGALYPAYKAASKDPIDALAYD